MEKVFVICLVFVAFQQVSRARDFSYGGSKGPNQWDVDYSSCKGKHQSPIDIDLLHVKKVKLEPLKLTNFDRVPKATHIENNGHTVQFLIEDEEEKPTVSGGPLSDSYEFSQLHFHWGDNDSYGSEDSFNGKHYPMELHVVFFKQEYGNVKEAMTHSDGLTVMAFFFQVGRPNPSYEELTELLSDIKRPESKASFKKPLALQDYIKKNLHEYYVYNGSLTTPPCLEVVTWLDFFKPLAISHDQLAKFRSLEDDEGDALTHNFRPVQSIGDRTVWFTSDNFHPQDNEIHDKIHGMKKSGGERVLGSLLGILFVILIQIGS